MIYLVYFVKIVYLLTSMIVENESATILSRLPPLMGNMDHTASKHEAYDDLVAQIVVLFYLGCSDGDLFHF